MQVATITLQGLHDCSGHVTDSCRLQQRLAWHAICWLHGCNNRCSGVL